MIVYRVEDRERRGPYIGGGVWGISDAHNNNAHPAPDHDRCISSRWHLEGYHLFGFTSEGMLRTWFDGWEDRLELAGFHIRAIRVGLDRVILGKHQLVFDERYAKREEIVPWLVAA